MKAPVLNTQEQAKIESFVKLIGDRRNQVRGDASRSLQRAIKSNNLSRVHEAIEAGADVNEYAFNSTSIPLRDAVRHGRDETDILTALIDAGADVNVRNVSREWTLLHYAAEHSNLKAAAVLLEHGAEVDARDKVGQTPLMSSDLHLTRLLVANGADVNAQELNGNTPLHHAAGWLAKPKVVEALLTLGADAQIRNDDGETPLKHLDRKLFMVPADAAEVRRVLEAHEARLLNEQLERNTAPVPSFPDLNDPATLDQIAASQAQEPKRRGMRL